MGDVIKSLQLLSEHGLQLADRGTKFQLFTLACATHFELPPFFLIISAEQETEFELRRKRSTCKI